MLFADIQSFVTEQSARVPMSWSHPIPSVVLVGLSPCACVSARCSAGVFGSDPSAASGTAGDAQGSMVAGAATRLLTQHSDNTDELLSERGWASGPDPLELPRIPTVLSVPNVIELFYQHSYSEGWKRPVGLLSPTSALTTSLRATSPQPLNTPRAGDSTTSLGSCAGACLAREKKCFLTPNLPLPWHNVRPSALTLLLLHGAEASPHLATTSCQEL